MFSKKYDKLVASLFAFLTFLFFILALTNRDFLDWAFARHHNQLSWFIRPLFLIPFCYFAYKRSWSGISITIFSLFTSMFWFPEPETVSEQVTLFLEYEVSYLTSELGLSKILLTLLVPISFLLLGLGFWKRNLWIGLSVIVMMALGKMMWSVSSAGESGKSIIIPALVGLLLCVAFIYWGFKILEKKKEKTGK
ncbi:flagellar biosynthesis protein FlhB [Metabacillus crassostreae]|uniref:hypothetical protein n=1 Tax=Metabacillus crassostreae TaxID=929098 RepID=UPI0019583A84|nr:hypothetical protein [Metabacillus crassostreae]MBM7605930.1 flagellar biosynthesis protein FlhB [Metabacillus crassostreae]